MNASLIIPTFNKLTRLRFVLKSLLILEDKECFEVIIVDDGSVDGTERMLNDFHLEAVRRKLILKIKRIENSGRSVARNYGVSKAEGELLIFSDDDLILSPNFIREHQNAHQISPCSVVRGSIYDLPFLKFFSNPETGELFDKTGRSLKGLQSFLLRMDDIKPSLIRIREQARFDKFEKDIHQLYEITPEEHPLRWVGCTGGNISIMKNDFLLVGGFDEKLGRSWGCEDIELGYRLKKNGANFIMNKQAENFHISHFRAQASYEHEQAMAYFMSKHPELAVKELNNYYEGRLSTLKDWKSIME